MLFALPRTSSTGEALVTTDAGGALGASPARARPRTGGGAPSSTPVLPPPGRGMTYSPVYFPGTTEPDAAAKITLGPGEERDGLAFSLRFTPTAKIEGTLVVPGGQPALVLLQLLPSGIGSAPAFETMFDAGLGGIPRVPVSPDGTFSIAGATAGGSSSADGLGRVRVWSGTGRHDDASAKQKSTCMAATCQESLSRSSPARRSMEESSSSEQRRACRPTSAASAWR